MRDQEVPTLRQFKIPVVLVVGASEELLGLVSEAALTAQVLVSECSVADTINTAAQMRPLVIIMPEDVYRQDDRNYEALARDVRAKILRVPRGSLDTDELLPELMRLMQEAEAQRPSWTNELNPR
ncbi:MAG: hypothetical protein KC731_27315 [Myxococcales bacterium]|nr:hypothetical protein [Myxococcales bacterium]